MKIFIPFQIQEIGGTSTFATKFKIGLEAAGHTATFDFCDDYDLLFVIVQCPFKYLLDAKRRGKKIVQRLDGTYYWTVSKWKFPLLNAKAAYIRHFFTDFTVYQSLYSQQCAKRFLGPKVNDRSSIIYNGVDLRLFSPTGPKAVKPDNPDQKIFLTASAFRRRDQIVPIIEAIQCYRQKFGDNFKLLVAGTFKAEVAGLPAQIKDKNIEFVGRVNNADLPEYERAADVFLFTHLNPPCPNNVIESLACGLPICGINDGAMEEIVGQSGKLLSVTGSGFWQFRHFNAKQFADNLHELTLRQKQLSAESRSLATHRFALSRMIAAYIEVFQSLLK